MKIRFSVSLIGLLLLSSFPALAQQVQKASVAGVVLDSNGEPIPNVRVTLSRLGVDLGPLPQMFGGDRESTISGETLTTWMSNMVGRQDLPPDAGPQLAALKLIPMEEIYEISLSAAGIPSVVYKSSLPVTTDARGRFSFSSADAGTYKLTFSAGGYAKQDYGERIIGAGGAPIVLGAQQPADIVMRLLKLGAISGTIHDSDGQPVAGVPVELFRFTYDQTGQKKNQRIAIARTDDSGEYRLHSLPPGRYYVRAGGPAGTPEAWMQQLVDSAVYGNGYSTPNRVPQFHAMTYYPGNPDAGSAIPIDLQSGADRRSVDLIVSVQRPFRVSGRVVDLRTGQPPQRVGFTLNPQGFSGPGSNLLDNRLGDITPKYNPADGSFEMQGINAGAYVLAAAIPNAPSVQTSLTLIINGDANNVVLAVNSGAVLKGRIREANAGRNAPLDSVRVQLRSETNGLLQSPPVAADGSFQIDNLRQGEYHFSFVGLANGFYVKEAKLGETDVLNGTLRYSASNDVPLNVLISGNAGAIEGTAVDAAGKPLPGAQVVIIPNQNRERAELFRPAVADSAGRYIISSVPPGEYVLAAWEALEPYAFFDPAFMRQAESQGKAIRVGESSNQRIDVTAIN